MLIFAVMCPIVCILMCYIIIFLQCCCVVGNNTLLRMLYEVDGDDALEGNLLDVPSLWRYRARVTLEHLKREVQEQKNSPYPVLDLFLREVVVVLVCCAEFPYVTFLVQLSSVQFSVEICVGQSYGKSFLMNMP